jgi:hypothetical protein
MSSLALTQYVWDSQTANRQCSSDRGRGRACISVFSGSPAVIHHITAVITGRGPLLGVRVRIIRPVEEDEPTRAGAFFVAGQFGIRSKGYAKPASSWYLRSPAA